MPYPQVYNRKTRRMEYLHRVVAAKQLGRALEPGEVVHHINGDKQDARPENLAVLRVGEHSWGWFKEAATKRKVKAFPSYTGKRPITRSYSRWASPSASRE